LVSEWRDRPEFKTAIDNIIDSFVGALFAPPGPAARIDVHAAVAPAIPVIVEGLEGQDVAVDEGTLVAALGDAAVLELDTGGASTVATIAQEARVILSRIVVLSILTMLVSGTVAIILSDETYAMVRTLAIRVSLSALSFAILFRIGSWALDPEGGRSPIASGGSVLLGSNGHVFIIIFVMASAVGIGGAWVAFNRRRAASARYGPDPLDDQPTGDGVRPGVQILDLTEDDTKEFVTA
jgi:hypothetical protein